MYPSVLLCAVYVVCISFAIYNWDVWSMADYSEEAAWLTFIAVGVFAVVGYLVDYFFFFKRKYVVGESTNPKNSIHEINVGLLFLWLNLIVCVVTVLWHLVEVRRIAGGASNWFQMMSIYRAKASYGVLSENERMPFILLQMKKYVGVQGYLIAYILTNNIIARGIKRRDVLLIIPVLMMSIQVIVNAGRLEILQLFASIMASAYILWHRKWGWNRNLSSKTVKIAFISLVSLLGVFYLSRGVVGRGGDFDLLYYVCIYVGGSIKLFDMYIKNPVAASPIWGKETFYTLNQFLSKFGNGHDRYIRHLEFRYVGGLNVGNVYTAPRRYIQDFGVSGMILLVIVFSFFMTYMYCKVKYSKRRYADYSLLLYCYLFSAIPMFPIDDIFFSSMISTSYIVNILLMYILFVLIVYKPIKIKIDGRVISGEG